MPSVELTDVTRTRLPSISKVRFTGAASTTLGFTFAGKRVRPPVEVRLLIDFDDRMFWNGVEIADEAELSRNLRSAAAAAERTIVRVEPDRRARYEPVAQVLAAAQRAQVVDITVRGISD